MNKQVARVPTACNHPHNPQERIDEVQRSLLNSKLPLGAKAKDPKAVEDYKFYRDMKDAKVFWDFRKVNGNSA